MLGAPSFIPANRSRIPHSIFTPGSNFRTLATVDGAPTLKTGDTRFPHSRPSLAVAGPDRFRPILFRIRKVGKKRGKTFD
jgi:hypothetical protein